MIPCPLERHLSERIEVDGMKVALGVTVSTAGLALDPISPLPNSSISLELYSGVSP